MKKCWEINCPTLEDSIKTAFKQIQKFSSSKKLIPKKLIEFSEHASQVTVRILFEPGIAETDISQWINNQRKQNVQ